VTDTVDHFGQKFKCCSVLLLDQLFVDLVVKEFDLYFVHSECACLVEACLPDFACLLQTEGVSGDDVHFAQFADCGVYVDSDEQRQLRGQSVGHNLDHFDDQFEFGFLGVQDAVLEGVAAGHDAEDQHHEHDFDAVHTGGVHFVHEAYDVADQLPLGCLPPGPQDEAADVHRGGAGRVARFYDFGAREQHTLLDFLQIPVYQGAGV